MSKLVWPNYCDVIISVIDCSGEGAGGFFCSFMLWVLKNECTSMNVLNAIH